MSGDAVSPLRHLERGEGHRLIAPRASAASHLPTCAVANTLPRRHADGTGRRCLSWNDAARRRRSSAFVDRVTQGGRPGLRAGRRRGSPSSTTTARSGASSRCTSRSPSRSTASRRWPRSTPSGRTKQPFKAVLEGRHEGGSRPAARKGSLELMAATHAGHDDRRVRGDRHATGSRRRKHPKFNRPYTEWSISRCWNCSPTCARTASRPSSSPAAASSSCAPWAEKVYGIPPEQVVGSSSEDEVRAARRQAGAGDACPRSTLIDDKAGQAGRHPSAHRPPPDRWRSATPTATSRCSSGRPPAPGPRFGLIVHHTDAEREWAYDRKSHVGKLARGLTKHRSAAGSLVDMKQDWKVIYPFQKP